MFLLSCIIPFISTSRRTSPRYLGCCYLGRCSIKCVSFAACRNESAHACKSLSVRKKVRIKLFRTYARVVVVGVVVVVVGGGGGGDGGDGGRCGVFKRAGALCLTAGGVGRVQGLDVFCCCCPLSAMRAANEHGLVQGSWCVRCYNMRLLAW